MIVSPFASFSHWKWLPMPIKLLLPKCQSHNSLQRNVCLCDIQQKESVIIDNCYINHEWCMWLIGWCPMPPSIAIIQHRFVRQKIKDTIDKWTTKYGSWIWIMSIKYNHLTDPIIFFCVRSTKELSSKYNFKAKFINSTHWYLCNTWVSEALLHLPPNEIFFAFDAKGIYTKNIIPNMAYNANPSSLWHVDIGFRNSGSDVLCLVVPSS